MIRIAVSQSDLDQCIQIRRVVFIQEQNVPESIELDEYDASAIHFLMSLGENPVGTARCIINGENAKIGRVAILKEERGKGYGLVLMQFVLDELKRRGIQYAALTSQTHALPFYEKLGFHAKGDVFLEANIPHQYMWKNL